MIRCAITRGSSTAKWLSAANRSYVTSISSSDKRRIFPKTTKPTPEVAIAREAAGVEDARGVSVSSTTGMLELKSYRPRDLPRSPFMDPKAIAARRKHYLPKPTAGKSPSLFQQQLAKNPYAQALVTPVRTCQLTKVPLPKYFLQDFQVMGHPETREPWWVPTSLRKQHKDVTSPEANEDVGPDSFIISKQDFEHGRPEADSTLSTQFESVSSSSPSENLLALPSHTPSIGPGTYTLSRRALLSAMQNPRSGWGPQPQQTFLAGSLMRSTIARKVREQAFWRTDMDTFILELMRRRVVEGLVYLAQRNRGYVAGCVGWEDATMANRQQAAILWTGLDNAVEDVDSNSEMRVDGPPSFATLTVGKDKPHMIPVHNLLTKLGKGHLAELRKKCPIFEKEVLIVRNKRITMDIQMKLWSLQGYLGLSEP